MDIDMAVVVAIGRSFVFSLLLVQSIAIEKRPVQAGPCQSYEAAYNLEARMREGMSLKEAKESVVQDGTQMGRQLVSRPSSTRSTKCPMPSRCSIVPSTKGCVDNGSLVISETGFVGHDLRELGRSQIRDV